MADWDLSTDPLLALGQGDPGPFEAFVRTHARVFFAYFRRQGAGLHRAEDLTQEVFLKLFHHAPRYRAQERLPAFCFRVARNVWIDDRRRARHRALELRGEDAPEELPEARDGAGPPEDVQAREEEARLIALLDQLPDIHRAVFELGVLEELPYTDIAAILDVPVGTVKSRMFHAVRKLRHLAGDASEGAA
jgi:RNA polymerase sigma-70 factor (ECF subfamily)